MIRHLARTAVLALAAAAPLGAQEQNPLNLFVADIGHDASGRLTLGQPRKLTHDEGRNSQPSFTPDGRAILFAAQRGGTQVDVYRIDLASGAETQVTHTPENENSPTVQPDGRMMVIRWKPETLFREWGPYLYNADGTPAEQVLPGPDTVGYYVRGNAHVFAFMRPKKTFTVALWDDRVKRMLDVDSPVAGLPPQKIPGANAVSYTRTDPAGRNVIRRVDLLTHRTADVVPAVPGRTMHAWTPDGVLLIAKANRVFALDTRRNRGWYVAAAFSAPELQNVTAFAVSPAGDRLVFYSTLKPQLHVMLRDELLDDPFGRVDAVGSIRWLAMNRRAEYEVSEGGIEQVGADWLARGLTADAVRVFTLAADLFPRSYDAQAQLADAYRKMGRNDEATAHYRRALALNPRTTDAEKTGAAEAEKALAEMGAAR